MKRIVIYFLICLFFVPAILQAQEVDSRIRLEESLQRVLQANTENEICRGFLLGSFYNYLVANKNRETVENFLPVDRLFCSTFDSNTVYIYRVRGNAFHPLRGAPQMWEEKKELVDYHVVWFATYHELFNIDNADILLRRLAFYNEKGDIGVGNRDDFGGEKNRHCFIIVGPNTIHHKIYNKDGKYLELEGYEVDMSRYKGDRIIYVQFF